MEKFGGIDWASEEHAACVVDEGGGRVRTDEAQQDYSAERYSRLTVGR